mmetsp:Transcript_7403/g.20233  ORF Transcript_7403/g.20233 Transcript_7403/m.20233 type:complete len:562 (+) Transcript_7403:204-1889(+)
MSMSAVDLILKKREGAELTEEEITWFVDGFSRGDIPDYQCSAWLMAVCLKGMSAAETAALTRAMVQSGSLADLSSIAGPKVDKHSTGGVGDKTSLIIAPIVASLGAVVPMMSGRGLGHTGGTLDKLESIPGFTVGLSEARFKEVLASVGVAIVSTTADMCPADRKMYALRDVTATVRAIPLQTASIMCKKLAENPDSLVLDVKTGVGAFNKVEAESIELAQSMIAAGERDGKATTAFVTSMEQPLGCAVGNWLEVAEAIRTLRGQGPPDLEELSVQLAAQMLVQAHGAKDPAAYGSRAAAAERARAQLRNGKALAAFRAMVVAQGGDPASVDSLGASPHGPERAAGAGGGEVVVLQGVFGSGGGPPVPLAQLQAAAGGPAAAHPPFWGPPVHGLGECRELEAFFERSLAPAAPEGGEGEPEAKRAATASVERSVRAPHGAPVAVVAGLDALAVGQACVAIGAGRRKLGEALTLGAGVLLHKKLDALLREGDVLFTLFAEVGGATAVRDGTRRAITAADVEAACGRVMAAYTFGAIAEARCEASRSPLIRCFVGRDGVVERM